MFAATQHGAPGLVAGRRGREVSSGKGRVVGRGTLGSEYCVVSSLAASSASAGGVDESK